MNHFSFRINPKKLAITFGVIFLFYSCLFAQESPNIKDTLSPQQRQARLYREEGYKQQQLGNMDEAMSLYQKAIELDPAYAVTYNDLGIVYEAKDMPERAEEMYLKAIQIDPNYLSAYSNLALLYENKRNLEKASFYWQKRVELGSPDDPWTQKAKERLGDLDLVLSKRPIEEAREQEVISLMKEVAVKKSILKKDDKSLAKEYFEKAKQSYDREDYATARKYALDACALDPANKEIEKFIEKVQIKALSQ